MISKILPVFIAAFFALFHDVPQASVSKNGFDLSNGLIKSDNIHSGGPSKDGIPALSRPQFYHAAQNRFLQDDAKNVYNLLTL